MGDTFEARDHADGSPLGTFPLLSADDVGAAVDAAREASLAWGEAPMAERLRALRAWRGRLWRASTELATLLHRETGMGLDEAVLEVLQTVEHLRWIEQNASRVLDATTRGGNGLLSPELTQRTRYAPQGVVGVLGSAHAPLYGVASAVAVALAAGNAVLVKPGEGTTATLVAYARKLPASTPVLQVITGDVGTAGALAAAPLDHACLFGSAAATARLSALCARSMVPVLTVPVGPPVTVVAPDADLRAAAGAVARAAVRRGDERDLRPEVFVAPDVSEEFGTHLDEALQGDQGAGALGLALGGGRVARALTGRRARRGEALALPSGSAPAVTVHADAEFSEVLEVLRERPHAHVSVFSRKRGERISQALLAAQVSINVGVGAEGAIPREALGSTGYGPLGGEDGLRTFARAVTVTSKRRLPGIPGLPGVPTGPVDALLATPGGRVAARLAMHIRHSLD